MSTTVSPVATESLFSARYRGATLGIVVLVSLVAFEAMAVSTAMPVAAQALGGLRQYGLAFSLFLTTSILGIVIAGSWTDRSGVRAPILVSLVCFAAGLLVSGTATGFAALLLGRAVSGFGGGLQVVCVFVVIGQLFPTELQPRVFGAISAAWVLPSVLGPPLAGFLTSAISWRAVFLVVPPLMLAPIPALWPRLRGAAAGRAESAPAPATPAPATPARAAARSRLVQGVALAAGVGVLQWGLQGGGAFVAAAGALVAAAALPPLLPAGTLRLRRGLPSLVLTRGLLTGAFIGADTFVPLMLVQHRGLDPALAGLSLTSGALGWSAASWFQGRPRLRIERTRLLVTGCSVVAVAVFALSVTALKVVPAWVVAPIWAVGGFGMGLAMASTSVLTLRLTPPGEEGRNSAGLQLSDTLGVVLGIGLAGALFAAGHDPAGDDTRIYSGIWLLLGVVGVLAAVAAARVGPRPPQTRI